MGELVTEYLAEWQVYNINTSTENYMGPKEQQEAIEYIAKKMMLNMTPITKQQLGIGYPANTDEELIKSIIEKAKIVVLNYSVKQNSVTTDHNIPNIQAF